MKKYYIVEKFDKDNNVNTSIRTVEALKDENNKKRYLDTDKTEKFHFANNEFLFERKSDAKLKIVELIEYVQEERKKKLIKKHKDELLRLEKTLAVEKEKLMSSIK